MTVEEFWNQAFLSALTKSDPEEAAKNADRALELCIEKWQANNTEWAHYPPLWQKQDVAHIRKLKSQS